MGQISNSLSDTLISSYGNIHHHRGKYIQSALVPLGASNIAQTLPPSPLSKDVPSHDSAVVPASIFAMDVPPPFTECKLPKPDERLADTCQLAYCLGVLRASSLPDDVLEPHARTWLHITEANEDEKDRLTTMATDVVRAFTRDELKDTKAVAEVICLAPVLESQYFRFLLKQFVDGIEYSGLLDTHSLEGLAQVLQGAAPSSIDADDLVRILKLLSARLQGTHKQSPDHRYQLTLAVSHVLDAMADSNVKGLDRVDLHAPLSSYLQDLQASKDPYLVYQAAYAFQALQCVPDNETPWQATVRRTGKVVKGVSGLVSAVKGLDVNGFIEGLGQLQGGLEEVFKVAKIGYDGVSSLVESGQGFLESLQEGLSFSRKRAWYPALRATDTLLQNGELAKFKTLVCKAPCRRELAFQWGVCQRLGNLAADPLWDADSRQGAVAFLGEIYRNDTLWGQEAQVKQCILDILMQLASETGSAMQGMCKAAIHTIVWRC